MKGEVLNKQSLYVTMLNTFIGLGASLLLKDNGVVAWVLGGLVVATVLFIERVWLSEQLFRNRKWCAYLTYSLLAFIFLGGLVVVTEPMRKTSAIITSTTTFLKGIQSGDHKTAYAQLSKSSRESYPWDDFTADHTEDQTKIKDFTIDQVTFNKFDNKKAQVLISSPFKIYGHESLPLELIKEGGSWRIVLSRKNVTVEKRPIAPKAKKKGGAVTNFLHSLF